MDREPEVWPRLHLAARNLAEAMDDLADSLRSQLGRKSTDEPMGTLARMRRMEQERARAG